MPISIHPSKGQLLLCDFEPGFKQPEMVKTGRPVIVISPKLKSRTGLVTVVACSTVKPDIIQPYHYEIPSQSTPKTKLFWGRSTWVKGDMVYSVGFHRLNLIQLPVRGSNGKRLYYTQKFGPEQMNKIYTCILHGMGLDRLAPLL